MWRKNIKSVGNVFKKRIKCYVINNLYKQFISYPQINNEQKNIIRPDISKLKTIHISTPLILVTNLYI